jgi:hypothetical protein
MSVIPASRDHGLPRSRTALMVARWSTDAVSGGDDHSESRSAPEPLKFLNNRLARSVISRWGDVLVCAIVRRVRWCVAGSLRY